MPTHRLLLLAGASALFVAAGSWTLAEQSEVITVPLESRAPGGAGPTPNFSPAGTRVALTDLPSSQPLPKGAVRPARKGTLQVGPSRDSWVDVLAAASTPYTADLTQIFVDANRNGNFTDDGPAVVAKPSQNDKTKAWWSSFDNIELGVKFKDPDRLERFVVDMWIVRDDKAPTPDVLRYSRRSWRSGAVKVNGVDALVAAMDANNDAVYGPGDSWSVVQASMKNAASAVLSHTEARTTSRFMFIERDGGKDLVLEFKSIARDGSSITFAVVDKPVTKAEDRLPDDMVREERPRPRTTAPFKWSHQLEDAIAEAKASGKRVFIDFETTWCGPCKTMDEWIWNDAEVAAALRSSYVGVKLDGDIEKAHVKRYAVKGYPTMVIVDAATGNAIKTVSGYQSSKQILSFVK
ncbi:MAG TPA: thioredoxin family protein [Vicinamibacterales bacterium]|nr:thioredoxin family protein [Vicinamibacterales bacterium]